MSAKGTKSAAKDGATTTLRPISLSFSSFFYAVAGAYYLVYPILVQDITLIPLYVIGVLSLIGSFGVFRMTRWGLWLGLLLFLPQVIAPAFALQVALQLPNLTGNYVAVAFASSLVVLLFLATLSFLLLLDKRRSFSPTE